MALIGNDAGWTQISREQVPSLGSNVACGLAYTGEGPGMGEAVPGSAGCVSLGLAAWWAGSLPPSDLISLFRLSQSSHGSGGPGLAALAGE